MLPVNDEVLFKSCGAHAFTRQEEFDTEDHSRLEPCLWFAQTLPNIGRFPEEPRAVAVEVRALFAERA